MEKTISSKEDTKQTSMLEEHEEDVLGENSDTHQNSTQGNSDEEVLKRLNESLMQQSNSELLSLEETDLQIYANSFVYTYTGYKQANIRRPNDLLIKTVLEFVVKKSAEVSTAKLLADDLVFRIFETKQEYLKKETDLLDYKSDYEKAIAYKHEVIKKLCKTKKRLEEESEYLQRELEDLRYQKEEVLKNKRADSPKILKADHGVNQLFLTQYIEEVEDDLRRIKEVKKKKVRGWLENHKNALKELNQVYNALGKRLDDIFVDIGRLQKSIVRLRLGIEA